MIIDKVNNFILKDWRSYFSLLFNFKNESSYNSIILYCQIGILFFLSLFINCSNFREEAIVNAFKNFNGDYILYIRKNNFKLYIFNRDQKLVSDYKIGYGLNPDKGPKLHEGDKRTPEGLYRIVEILSIDADKNSNTYKKLEKMNRYYFQAKDGHYKFGKFNEDLGDNAEEVPDVVNGLNARYQPRSALVCQRVLHVQLQHSRR